MNKIGSIAVKGHVDGRMPSSAPKSVSVPSREGAVGTTVLPQSLQAIKTMRFPICPHCLTPEIPGVPHECERTDPSIIAGQFELVEVAN